MIAARRLWVALVVLGLSSSGWADVLPARRTADSGAPARVEARLVELGYTAETARAQVQRLTADDAEYFAQHPDRLQLAGQEMWGGQSDNLWWEWVFGAVFLAGAIITIANLHQTYD